MKYDGASTGVGRHSLHLYPEMQRLRPALVPVLDNITSHPGAASLTWLLMSKQQMRDDMQPYPKHSLPLITVRKKSCKMKFRQTNC